MLLHKIQIIPTAVPVTKSKQNLGEKSLRLQKTNKIPLNTNKIPFKTNKISINSKHSLNHHEDFLGFVHKKNKCTKPSSKLLKDYLVVIEQFLGFFIWNPTGKCLCLYKKTSSRNDDLLPFVFILFVFILFVSCL